MKLVLHGSRTLLDQGHMLLVVIQPSQPIDESSTESILQSTQRSREKRERFLFLNKKRTPEMRALSFSKAAAKSVAHSLRFKINIPTISISTVILYTS